jgi:hypothetical protein
VQLATQSRKSTQLIVVAAHARPLAAHEPAVHAHCFAALHQPLSQC